MLCRAILTTVAISCTFSEIPLVRGHSSPRLVQIKDVICVLLLSGLQKEDLGANVLNKLRRHNVNIDNMNTESLREGCLFNSYLDIEESTSKYELIGNQNSTSVISTNKKKVKKTDLNRRARKNGSVTKTTNDFANEIKIKHYITMKEQKHDDNTIESSALPTNQDDENVTILESHKDEVIKYIHNEPSLQSVLQFWNKFTPKTDNKSDITKMQSPTRIEEMITSTSQPTSTVNIGYVHSREREYINRLIAEYLASQTVPTTTQVTRKERVEKNPKNNLEGISSEKAKFRDTNKYEFINNIKHFINKNEKNVASDERTLDSLIHFNNKATISTEKVVEFFDDVKENFNNHKKLMSGAISRFGKLITINNKDAEAGEKVINMTHNDLNNWTKTEQFEIQYNPTKSITKIVQNPVVNKLTPRIALQYLDSILGGDKEMKNNNAVITDTENSTQNPNIDNLESKNPVKFTKTSQQKIENVNTNNQVNNNTTKNDQIISVPEGVIEAIAEKVKEIVIKDIKEEITTSIPTVTTTALIPKTTKREEKKTFPITAITTERTTTPDKDAKDKNQVLQTLMELFKEFQLIKDSSKTTTDTPLKVSLNEKRNTYSPPLAPVDVYSTPLHKTAMTNVRPMEMNLQHLVPIPFGPIIMDESQHMSQLDIIPRHDFKGIPITIQTNSNQIAPLVIPVANEVNLVNQHIILTTQNPFEKEKEARLQTESKNRIDKILNIPQQKNHHVQKLNYPDLSNKIRIAETVKKKDSDSYKDRLQKFKERREKYRELSHPSSPNRQDSIGRQPEPVHQPNNIIANQGINSNINLNRETSNQLRDWGRQKTLSHPVISNHHKALSQIHHLNSRYDASSKPAILNPQDILSQPRNINHHEVLDKNRNIPMYPSQGNGQIPYNQPSNIDREEMLAPIVYRSRVVPFRQRQDFNRPMDLDGREMSRDSPDFKQENAGQPHMNRGVYLNRQMDLEREEEIGRFDINRQNAYNQDIMMQPEVQNNREFGTHGVINRQPDVMNQMVDYDNQPAPIDGEDMNQNYRADMYDGADQELPYPRYKAKKYHEKLERLQNRGQYDKRTDVVAARQQRPLNKLTKHVKHDDTHFRNFLKSQQKVTDMLESLLAEKTKTKQAKPSAETS